jgi:hypothetical protein
MPLQKFYLEEVDYELDEGYTLNAKANGPKSFKCRGQWDGSYVCGRDGKYSKTFPEPVPVNCGKSPVLDFADGTTDEYVFEEKSQYTCQTGYSLDGSPPKKITCSLTVDNELVSVYWNGADITSDVKGNFKNWQSKKTFTVGAIEGAYLVITGKKL